MMVAEPAIEVEQLCRRFAGSIAIDQLDLCVGQGEIFGFLGPNGAGKTTTMRMLCTLLRPTSGNARVASFDLDTDPAEVRRRIGVALQSSSLDGRLTGREHLVLQARLFRLSRERIASRVGELVDLIDLGEALDRRVTTYSSGMKRRLDLAVALVHSPEIVFLDEPTTGLDPASRSRLWEEVRRLNHEAGVTVFLTTQYLEEADVLAHRVAIVDQGRMVAEGSPEELKASLGTDVVIVTVDGNTSLASSAVSEVPRVRQVSTFGQELTIRVDDGEAAVGPIAGVLQRHGIAVRHVILRTPTLDDVFLELTGGRLRGEAVQSA